MSRLRYRALDWALATGSAPDGLLRAGCGVALDRKERRERKAGADQREAIVARMSSGPIAEVPHVANRQHYELPAEFFGLFLGPRRKYSACLYAPGVRDLAGAEEAMLARTCATAGIADGMRVLDLGCGWGALALYLLERYDVRVTAVSNSSGQRAWIEAEAGRRGVAERLTVVTADVAAYEPRGRFDRIVSVEMFEHLRNWELLLRRMAAWTEPDGRIFVHVFSHRSLAYRFEGTWAAERFFTAGTMPSHDLLPRLATSCRVASAEWIDGLHYARTLDDWLARLDRHADEAAELLARDRPARLARAELQRWRLFLIATAEMWRRNDGTSWGVSHYLLEPERRLHGTSGGVVAT